MGVHRTWTATAAGVVVGTWRRRRPGLGDEVIRLVRAGEGWQVHRTGHRTLRDLTEARALAEVARIVGDCWVYYPPPRRFRGAVVR